MLHVDIPNAATLKGLVSHRDDMCVSIYLATTPLSQDAQQDRIELKNLAREAQRQLEDAGADKRRTAAVLEHVEELADDYDFWNHQAHSLAILATPDNLRTFRLPNKLKPMVEVSDRFHLKPLLRSVSFPHACHVLALAEGSVRLVEVSADLPAVQVRVEGLPKDASSATMRSTLNDRAPSGRIQGSEGQKVLLRQYARKVDAALRGYLHGSDLPLVLAAAQPLASIYRSVSSVPHLAAETIEGSPERISDADLAAHARKVLDGLYRREVAEWTDLFRSRSEQGRATADVAQAARAATFGAVETLLVDIDDVVPGRIADEDGAVSFADAPGPKSYGIVDEIAGRVLLAGGRVLGVRRDDIPQRGPLAAVLRYPV